MNTSDIVEHMEVVGSDGQHVGTVDHLALKLTKTDAEAGGEHHVIDFELVDSLRDGKIVLRCSADQAKGEQAQVED